MTLAPRTWLTTGAVGLAGLAAGGVLATTLVATAQDSGNDTTASQPDSRPDEQPLTGATAAKVRAAALATHPRATVERVETDADGVYEAHLVTADGTPVTVQVDKSFTVTGTREGGPAGGPAGGPGRGFGDRDGDDGTGSGDGTGDGSAQDSLATL